MTTKLQHINVADIFESEDTLRKVDTTTEGYYELVESIKLKGIMNPISVREVVEPESGRTIYGLVDGLHRFTAAKDAGLDTVPAHVIDIEEGELIEAQIIANAHKIETKPVEYSKALLKVLDSNPMLTKLQLAERLAKSESFINDRLGLLKLTESIGKLVDEGKITLTNAYVLAKLDPEEQGDFVDRAMAMPPGQFAPTVNQRIKENRDAKRKGRDPKPAEFQPVPLLRSRAELVAEHEAWDACRYFCNELSTAEEGFRIAIKWALKLDPDSVEVQKAEDEQRKAEREKAKEKAKVERARKRAKEAAEKAEALKQELEEVEA